MQRSFTGISCESAWTTRGMCLICSSYTPEWCANIAGPNPRSRTCKVGSKVILFVGGVLQMHLLFDSYGDNAGDFPLCEERCRIHLPRAVPTVVLRWCWNIG